MRSRSDKISMDKIMPVNFNLSQSVKEGVKEVLEKRLSYKSLTGM